MAAFPSLRPSSRKYDAGEFPLSVEQTYAGSLRFRHGDANSNHSLELGFSNLSQFDARQIRNHYRNQDGSHRMFTLSALAWAGHTSQTDIVPSTTFWKYAVEPQETHKVGGWIDVTVQLVSVF